MLASSGPVGSNEKRKEDGGLAEPASILQRIHMLSDKIQKQQQENATGGRGVLPIFAFHVIKLKRF